MQKWANWKRQYSSIPRCSNHYEGFHRNINSTLAKKGFDSFTIEFGKIVNNIIKQI